MSPLILVLCDPSDHAALRFRSVLQRLAPVPVELLTLAELTYAPDLTQWMGDGPARASVTTDRLGVLDSDRLTGVINRLDAVPDAHLAAVAADDRAYTLHELNAVLTSWLLALRCPVIGLPTATWTLGTALAPGVWTHLAGAAGLAVDETAIDVDVSEPAPPPANLRLIAFDGRVFGPIVPNDCAIACARLAQLAGCRLLEVSLFQNETGVRFASASPWVDFAVGGRPLAQSVLSAFVGDAQDPVAYRARQP